MIALTLPRRRAPITFYQWRDRLRAPENAGKPVYHRFSLKNGISALERTIPAWEWMIHSKEWTSYSLERMNYSLEWTGYSRSGRPTPWSG